MLALALLLNLLIKLTRQTKLVMTVVGGPYHCLAPGSGKDVVLYGDVWDRGYRYNATTDKDLNKCEGAHSNKYVDGMAQYKGGAIIITAGSDGAVAFWDVKTNRTIQRIADVVGPAIALTDLILTPNEILILTADHPKNNVLFLPLEMRESRKFEPLQSSHDSAVYRVKMVRLVPMFITLGGKNKIARWSCFDPPRLLQEYTVDGVLDAAVDWKNQVMYLAKEDHSIESISVKDNKKLHSLPNAHDNKVTGISLVPHVGYFVSGGGMHVKIWDKDFKLIETLTDSKANITGYTMYKYEDKLIGVMNQKGLVFWKQCDLPFCQACANATVCHTCEFGYKQDAKGICKPYGSDPYPIKWNLTHLNIDRTKFRVTFIDVEGEIWNRINALDPKEHLKLGTGDKADSGEAFDYVYEKQPSLYSWDVLCTFRSGLGLRNLTGIMSNKSARILQEYTPLDYAAVVPGAIFFEPGPKHTPIPSMPAFSFSVTPLFFVLGCIYRIILWAIVLLMSFDAFRRFSKGLMLDTFSFIKYIYFYYQISFVSLLMINMRPVVTESNIGLHWAIHVGYFGIPEFRLDLVTATKGYLYRYKITDYETSMVILDRFLVETGVYFVLIIASIVLRGELGQMLGILRFIVANALGANYLFSAILQIMNYFVVNDLGIYRKINFWCSWFIIMAVLLEYSYFALIGLVGNTLVIDPQIAGAQKELGKIRDSQNPVKKDNSEIKAEAPIEKIISKNKPVVHQTSIQKMRAFFMRVTDFSKVVKDSYVRKSSVFNSKEIKPNKDFILRLGNICAEANGAFMRESWFVHTPSRLYMMYLPLRTFITVLLVIFLDFDRVIQAWILLLITIPGLICIILAIPHLKFKHFSIIQEVCWILWMLIVVINAHDDIEPTWELSAFWIFSIIEILCRLIIMLTEIALIILTCLEMLANLDDTNKSNGLQYRQEGYTIDNVKIESEREGFNHFEIIGTGLEGKTPAAHELAATEHDQESEIKPKGKGKEDAILKK